MAAGLRAINRLAASDLVDRLGLRHPTERFLHGATRTTSRTAARASRTFAKVGRHSRSVRLPSAAGGDLFDLTPTEEQTMLRESAREFALARLRPAAQAADGACATPAALLAQSAELGLTMVGVPEQLGGAVEARSAVSAVLLAEALAEGDMGIALACLAPAGVASAISLWGDGEQQATYLPALVGADLSTSAAAGASVGVPAAAVAVLEPRPLFDPFQLETSARAANGGFVLDGAKALVPRAADGELFIVGAMLVGENGASPSPALFIVESGTPGISVEPEPAMGIRAAATGRLIFERVRLPASSLLGGGARETYAECIHLGRLGWCALAVGTARAVLDYVAPYVNERRAFGEPISNRQAVAFTIADIAIELDGR
jgi:alkylation response protein AidB-like acyl-CoA dehydrogenase